MAMGSFDTPGTQMPTAEINMTPLVDVMLVLLIIFIITAPLMTHAVRVDLPRASSNPTPDKRAALQVAIDANNGILVGHQRVEQQDLEAVFREAVARDSEVEMHLKADRATRYETVAAAMSAARRAGVARIGFVTQQEPSPMP